MEKICLLTIVALCACASLSWAKPESTEHGAASHKTAHMKDGIHNPVFDHEALFGAHNYDEIKDLPDDVKLNRLRTLAKSLDTNGDGKIDKKELNNWILQSFKLLDYQEASSKFDEDDEDSDGKVTCAEIIHKQYGHTEEEVDEMEKKKADGKQDPEDSEEEEDIIRFVTDDRKRFKAADLDQDGALSKEEYVAFFQPYDYPHMYAVEMERAVADMDKDKDNFISMDEFIGETDDEETRISEQTNFEELDKDKDGRLSEEELRPWALPDNSDIAVEETEHLLKECDEDGDGELTIDEIVNKEQEFTGSSATDYGRHYSYIKDEL